MQINVPRRMVQTYKESFLDEVYFKGFPKNYLSSKPVIIDIGANVGYFSLFSLVKYPDAKVVSFEPMPMNFKLLQKYCSENTALDFTPVNKAVSGSVGHITLQYDANDTFTTSASIFDSACGGSDTLKVETTTLADILDTHGLDKVDLLKLDCEGSEYSILYNAEDKVWDRIGALTIETHVGNDAYENRDHLVSHLQLKGYTTKIEGDIVWAYR